MKKLLLGALIALLVSCGFTQSPDVIAKTSDSLFRVSWDATSEEGEPMAQRCTGFKVGIVWVVTAEHCVPPKGVNAPVFVGDHEARIVKIDGDLAMLEIPQNDEITILQVAKSNPSIGTPVMVLGYAWATSLHVFSRHVAAYEHGWLTIDGPVAPGMSGGPIIDDKGKVVGLVQAASPIIGLNCTAKELRDFIK